MPVLTAPNKVVASTAGKMVTVASGGHVDSKLQPVTRIRAKEPGAMERLNDSMAMTAAWIAPMAISGITSIGKKAEKWPILGAPLRGLAKLVHPAHQALNSEIGDLPGKVIGKVAKWTGSETLSGVAASVADRKVQVVESGGRLLTKAADLADDATNKGILGQGRTWAKNKAAQRAGKMEANAVAYHATAIAHLDTAIDSLKGEELQAARGVLKNTRNRLAAEGADAIKAAHAGVDLGETKQAYSTAVQALKKEKGALSDAGKQAIAQADKSIGDFTKYAAKMQGNFGKAGTVKAMTTELKQTLGSIPGRISKAKLEGLPTHAYTILSQGTSAIRAERAFATRMDTLKNMYASVTGTDIKQVSGIKLALGLTKLPPSMQDAVKDYWRGALPESGSHLGAMWAFHKMNKSSGLLGGMKLMLGIQAASTLVSAVVAPKNDLLQAYRAIAEVHGAGKTDVPKIAYAALAVAAKPSLRELEMSDPALLQVSQHYAQTKAKASTLLKDIDSGVFDKLYAQAKLSVKPAGPAAAAQTAPVGKFTEGLLASGRKAPDLGVQPAASHTERALSAKAVPAAAESARI